MNVFQSRKGDVMACEHWAGDGCTAPGCGAGESPPLLDDGRPDTVTELRRLLMEWERFGRTMAAAGVIALPERLMGRTVGLLDATAC
jgi:hypothetical protein